MLIPTGPVVQKVYRAIKSMFFLKICLSYNLTCIFSITPWNVYRIEGLAEVKV